MPDYVKYNAQGLITKRWRSVDPSVVEGLQNILQIDRATYESLTMYHIVDSGQVREMNQAEKDTLDAWLEQQRQQRETDRINALDDKMNIDLSGIVLQKADTAIDNIGSLTDAKAFLKKLVRYIIKFISRNIA